jgi:lipoyl(octanoyl) transferase
MLLSPSREILPGKNTKPIPLGPGIRVESHAGVWIGQEELAAIGLSVQSWVAMHGFALNIHPRLEHFSSIKPCGFPDRRAASMATLLGYIRH